MTNPRWMQKIGATPGKLALVGVLGIVLIAVIAVQLPGRTDSAGAAATRRQARTRSESKRRPAARLRRTTPAKTDTTENKKPASESVEAEPRHWPELPLEEIVGYDPLATPHWLAEARRAAPPEEKRKQLAAEAERQQEKANLLEKLREQGIQAVVISAGKKEAIIGDQPVHVGDFLEGFQVTDITKQGVVLKEIQ